MRLTPLGSPFSRQRWRVAAVILVAVLGAEACATAPRPAPVRPVTPTPRLSSTPSAAPAAAPVEQSLTMAIEGELVGGLSNAADGTQTRTAASFLYNGLYGYDERLTPVPVLARELATVSADGLRWTIGLRDGVTFHDGTALTADDVVQTYKLAASRNCAFSRTLCLGPILERVEKVDDLTVAFTLTRKLASFATTHLGIWIDSEDAVDASYARFRSNALALTAAEVTSFLDEVASEEAGSGGAPRADYARFRADGEALLTRAGVPLPRQAPYTTDGDLDVGPYVRDITARLRAVDASFTSRPVDALAAAYPYLDVQVDPVGSGPFRFDAYVPGVRLEFSANNGYFLGAPAIKRLSFPFVGSETDAAQALVDGTNDWLPGLDRSIYDQIKDDPELRFVEYLEPSFLGLYFNLHPESDALFLDRNLRQAVAYCLDKPATVALATHGHGAPIYSEIPPVSWAYPAAGLKTYPRDQVMARRLIEASGWTTGADGIYEKAGRKLATVVAVRSGFPQRSRWLALLGDQVRECGIDIGYREVGFAAIVAMLDVYPHRNAAEPALGRPFDAYFGGLTVGRDPDPFRLYHSSECSTAERPSTFNHICYANPAVDRLIEAGLVTFEQAERARIYQQYAVLQSDDLPVLYAWSDRLRDALRATVGTTATGGLRLDTPTWFREGEKLTNVR